MLKQLQKFKYISIGTLFFLVIILVGLCFLLVNLRPGVKVSYLDVGQGDATLVSVSSGPKILIDTGPGRAILAPLDKKFIFSPHRIDAIVLTHFDSDHIGGTSEILKRYSVGQILVTHNSDKSEINDVFLLAKEKNIPVKIIRRGDYLDLGNNSAFQVLFPDQNVDDWEENTTSAVLRLVVGNESFIFSGDAPQAVENLMAYSYGSLLKTDVLKLGHHGSKTSTSDIYLSVTNPDYAVISAGLNNRYGHPHKEVLDKLNIMSKKILETFKEGTINFFTDGNNFERK